MNVPERLTAAVRHLGFAVEALRGDQSFTVDGLGTAISTELSITHAPSPAAREAMDTRREAAMDLMSQGLQGYLLVSFHDSDEITDRGAVDFEIHTSMVLTPDQHVAVDAVLADARQKVGLG